MNAYKNHVNNVDVHPAFSAHKGIRYAEIALPAYVQELSSPDITDSCPFLARRGGTIQMSRRFTPCIHALKIAESNTENTAFAFERINNKRALTAPAPKIAPEQVSGFLSFLAYKYDVI